ncbi:hypothetical protein JJQ93_00920 [Thermoanaerobacterium sp. R66]|nr:hypothetical protein [Thermoanaerobacterium sp. R66]
MCGGAHLDIAMKELTSDKRLRFNWDLAYICKRESPLIHARKVVTAYKHVIWLVKGICEGELVYDVIEAPPDDGTDITYHRWGGRA